jgi:purine-binding chemotaxis protein CheW
VASEDLRKLQRALLAQQRAHPPARGASALQSEQLRTDVTAPGVPAEVPGEQYLAFTLLDREFAFKAEYIQGVERLLEITPVPNVAPWIRGVVNLRGSIASVVDLRTFLDREPLPYSPRTRLLSVQHNDMLICLVVDSVSGMLPIPDNVIASLSTRQTTIPQWAAPYAAGTAVLGRRAIVLLDAPRLLFSERMQHYEALD